ncbi:hypothetical protein NIES4071_66000 [Calothrix sp. NIES-4071]|nr:hypothetical protein NIES4071_66000 [Calothrix sp. NIES-4071]BAZ60904.1 hypothetical protein NIES4105_65960 [Calothrix sp. NIES-4105]
MLKLHYPLLKQPKARMLRQSVILSSLTAVTIFASTLLPSTKAYAQNPPVSATEIVNYAKSVLAMELPRLQALEEIKQMMGGEVPKIVCNDPNSFNALPGRARNIAVNYCNNSQKIVENNGLSIDRFNEMTVLVQKNEGLQQQIYNQLIILQKKPDK